MVVMEAGTLFNGTPFKHGAKPDIKQCGTKLYTLVKKNQMYYIYEKFKR